MPNDRRTTGAGAGGSAGSSGESEKLVLRPGSARGTGSEAGASTSTSSSATAPSTPTTATSSSGGKITAGKSEVPLSACRKKSAGGGNVASGDGTKEGITRPRSSAGVAGIDDGASGGTGEGGSSGDPRGGHGNLYRQRRRGLLLSGRTNSYPAPTPASAVRDDRRRRR